MNYYSEIVNKLTPYVPGEQPNKNEFIKLNTNENPYPPSSNVVRAIKNFNFDELRLYPNPEAEELKEVYSKYLKVKTENIFVGNGSDEVLAIAFQTFFMDKENVLMPNITYSFYPVYCNLYNVKAKEIPLKKDFSIDINDYKVKNNGIIIANPNAPTGLILPIDKIEDMVKNNRNSVVIVDEAYVDFGEEGAYCLINRYNNLLIIRTLSKSYSLAGMRIGFAIGNAELIEGMNRVKNSFNSYPIDRLAQVAAIEAIKDVDYFNETRNKIILTRDLLKKELVNLGFNVLDSKANFLFISNPKIKAEKIFNLLKANKILVRYFKNELLDNWLRVSIGTDEEMYIFLEIIKKIVGETNGKKIFFNKEIGEENKNKNKNPNINYSFSIFEDIYNMIDDRYKNPKKNSYTNYLLAQGIDKICKKVGEEASETIIASKNSSKDDLIGEICDLIYHVLVLMFEKNIKIDDVKSMLIKRHSVKGNKKTENKRGEY